MELFGLYRLLLFFSAVELLAFLIDYPDIVGVYIPFRLLLFLSLLILV